jgi:RNA polymerase sigma-70 factor (ECF subfamily)
MSDVDVDQAVREVRQGCRESYRQVIDVCESKVRLVLAAVLPSPSLVEDLVQEVFIQAYHKLDEYRAGTDFIAWIREIARNLALNERRRWLRRQSATRRYRARIEETLERDLFEAAPKGEADAFAALRDCLRGLEDGVRQVVEKYYWQGLPGAAIAQALGRSAEWTRVVLHRAREALAHCLQNKGILYGG